MNHAFSVLSSLVLAALLSGCASTIPQGAWAPRGLPNFAQVDPRLYRGAQPSPAGIEELRKMRIATIVDLRQPDEDPKGRQEEQYAAQAAGLHYYSVPMTGSRAPTREEIRRVLDLIEDPKYQPVFIHCRRGADRTGAMVAIYRVTHHGWTAEQAIQEAMDQGMKWNEFCLRGSVRKWEKRMSRSIGALEASAKERPGSE